MVTSPSNIKLHESLEHIKTQIYELEVKMRLFDKEVLTLKDDVKNVKTQTEANTDLLTNIDATLTSIFNFVRKAGKWLVGVITGVVVIVLAYYLLAFFHITH